MLSKTNTLLLQQLHDPRDEEAWREFDARYRPVLLAFAGRLGLGEADAEEAAQATLTRFMEYYRKGHYDRSRGRLRSWIFAIADRCVRDLHRGRARHREWRGESGFLDLQDRDHLQATWDEEWRRAVTSAALAELRAESHTDPRTLRAFEMLTLEERTAKDTAAELHLSVNSVYVAKHRVIQRLRTILTRLEDTF